MIGKDAAQNVPNAMPPAGLPSSDPGAMAKINEAMKIRGFDILQAGIQGAAAGGQAGANAGNPLQAFIQGSAAGLAIPAQIYQQKKEQVQSVMDATPFGVIVKEAMDPNSPYHALSGMPYGIAKHAIAGIAQDTAKAIATGQEARKTELLKQDIGEVQPGKDAENAANLLSNSDLNGRTYKPEDVVGMPKETLYKFINANKDSGGAYFRGGKRLSDSEMGVLADMVHSNNTSLTDTLSTYQRGQLAIVYAKRFPGDSLTMRIANSKNIENPQIQQQLRTMASVVDPSPTGDPSIADQLLAAHKALNNTDTGGAPSSALNYITTKWKGLTHDQKLANYESLRNTYAMEVARALTGGVPTNERLELELAPLAANNPHSSIQSAVENSRNAIHQRMEQYLKPPTQEKPVANPLSTMSVGTVVNGLVKTPNGWEIAK